MSSWETRLIHPQAKAPDGFKSLVAPIHRASTTLFASAADAIDHWDHDKAPYSYGLYGTPTTLELAARIAEIENGRKTFLTPGGQSAIALIYMSFLNAGDHVLVPESIYGPNRNFADVLLRRFGVEIAYYVPTTGGAISQLLRKNTRLVWCESPGSVTMEVQDVRAIADVAHRHGAIVALDNTWSAGVFFDAFAHGVDVTMQALTKYVGGHSDILLGSVTVNDQAHYLRLGNTLQGLGMAVSPDDCALAIRGLQTLAVRLGRIESSALEVANWLAGRPEVETVLHPALKSCPGHELWLRDFTGSAGIFSIVLRQDFRMRDVVRFIDHLRLFKVGYSWGGAHSLAVPWSAPSRGDWRYGDRLIRLNIGLEDSKDLMEDLAQGLDSIADGTVGSPADLSISS